MFASRQSKHSRWLITSTLIASSAWCVAAAAPKTPAPDPTGEVTHLPAFNVKGERLEDFGFRISPDLDFSRSSRTARVYSPVVDVVLPNTAASKAGIRPGDRILTADGVDVSTGSMSRGPWRRIQKKKWNEVIEANGSVTWTLQVETAGTNEIRTLVLRLPTPAPRWGSTVWRVPEDRIPIVVPEPGPLARRAEEILNNGIWVILRRSYLKGFSLPTDATHPNFLCYQWTVWSGSIAHRMYVSRQRDRTDIIFEVISHVDAPFFSNFSPAVTPEESLSSATTVLATDSRTYLTSPSGVLEAAWRLPRSNKQEAIPLGLASEGFQAEVDFWLTKVGKVSSLWPLGVIDGASPATK